MRNQRNMQRKMEKYRRDMASMSISRRLEVRRKQIFDEFKEDFKIEIELNVPRWAEVISLYIPPGIYRKIVNYVFNAQKLGDFIANVKKKPWTNNRKRLNIWGAVFVYRIAVFVLEDWVLGIRRFFRTFGVSAIIFESREGYLKQVIKCWGKIVSEKEIKIGV